MVCKNWVCGTDIICACVHIEYSILNSIVTVLASDRTRSIADRVPIHFVDLSDNFLLCILSPVIPSFLPPPPPPPPPLRYFCISFVFVERLGCNEAETRGQAAPASPPTPAIPYVSSLPCCFVLSNGVWVFFVKKIIKMSTRFSTKYNEEVNLTFQRVTLIFLVTLNCRTKKCVRVCGGGGITYNQV